jgi:hypothetical protein
MLGIRRRDPRGCARQPPRHGKLSGLVLWSKSEESMFVQLELDVVLGGWQKHIEQRVDFWQRFQAADQNRPYSTEGEIGDTAKQQAEEYEHRFRMFFPNKLQDHVNEELRRAWKQSKTAGPPKVDIRLASVEYGSLKALLDVTGIDSSEVRDFVLSLLMIYSPIAFREALATEVTTRASAWVVGEDLRIPENARASSRSGMQALGNAWLIANTSLLVPVATCHCRVSALRGIPRAHRPANSGVIADQP